MNIVCTFNQKYRPGFIKLKIHQTTGEKMKTTWINGIIFLSMDEKRNPHVDAVSVSLKKIPQNEQIRVSIGDDHYRRIRTYKSISHIKYNEKLSFYKTKDGNYLCILIPNKTEHKTYILQWYKRFFKIFK